MNDEDKGRGRRNRIPKTIDLEASEITRVDKPKADSPVSEAMAAGGDSPAAAAGAGEAAERVSPDGAQAVSLGDAPGDTGRDLEGSGVSGAPETGGEPAAPSSAQSDPTGDDQIGDDRAGADAIGANPIGDDPARDDPVDGDPDEAHPQQARGRIAPFVLAGMAGGILALALAGGLVASGVVGQMTGGQMTGEQAAGAAPDGIDSRFTALQERLARLEAAPAPAAGIAAGEFDALASRLASAQEAIAALQQAGTASGGESDGRIDAIASRLEAAEAEIASLRDAVNESRQADPRVVMELSGRVETLAGDLDRIGQASDASASRIEAAEAGLADVTQKVESYSEARARADSQGRALARSVAANALRTAYDRGAPFAGLLASAHALSDSDAAIAALEPHATLGVATDAALLADFRAVASQAIAASRPREDGVVAQLFTNARSLVQVRPVGPQAGGAPEAIVSRVEAHLQSGEMAQALAEWRSLPEASRGASAGFGQALESRVAADKAMAELLDSLARNEVQG